MDTEFVPKSPEEEGPLSSKTATKKQTKMQHVWLHQKETNSPKLLVNKTTILIINTYDTKTQIWKDSVSFFPRTNKVIVARLFQLWCEIGSKAS